MTIIPEICPSDEDANLDELLMRYWLNKASADERVRIEAWLDQHPEYRGRSQHLHHGIKAGQWTSLAPNVIAERTVKILNEGNVFSEVRESKIIRHTSKSLRYTLGAIAAAMLLLVFGWRQHRNDSVVSNIATSYATGNGERATVMLPDGSTVVLNVASRLEVSPDFGRGSRDLTLVGEALFTVAHTQGEPFTVTTGSYVTRVLGTSFIVRQYPTDTVATVAVREGKVSVGSTVLTAGHETSMGLGATLHIQPVNIKRFGFAQGTLFVESRPLIDAIPDLNRWYDADIRLGDSTLATQRVVGSFEVGSITDLMWMLQIAYDVRVVRDGRVLTLYPRG